MHFSVHALAVCCDMSSNQLASLGISLWPTAQEATVGPSKSFLDILWRPIKYPKHVSLQTKTHLNSFHTHISQPDFECSNFETVFIPVQRNPVVAYLALWTNNCLLLHNYELSFIYLFFIYFTGEKWSILTLCMYNKEGSPVMMRDRYQTFMEAARAFRMSRNDVVSTWSHHSGYSLSD